MTEPTQTPNVLPNTNMEEQEDYEYKEDCDDYESEDEQHSIVLFMLE